MRHHIVAKRCHQIETYFLSSTPLIPPGNFNGKVCWDIIGKFNEVEMKDVDSMGDVDVCVHLDDINGGQFSVQ